MVVTEVVVVLWSSVWVIKTSEVTGVVHVSSMLLMIDVWSDAVAIAAFIMFSAAPLRKRYSTSHLFIAIAIIMLVHTIVNRRVGDNASPFH